MAENIDEIFEEDADDIVTLINEDGDEIDFVEIAGIAHEGKFYALLQPVELLEGMEDDEAFAFEVTTDGEGENHFNMVTDDELLDIIFEKYNQLLDSADDADE